jgi:hypothetical protein
MVSLPTAAACDGVVQGLVLTLEKRARANVFGRAYALIGSQEGGIGHGNRRPDGFAAMRSAI